MLYSDVWREGLTSRVAKLAWLEEGAESGTLHGAVEVARGLVDDMRPGPFENGAWPSLRSCFLSASSGLQSKRDHVVYDTTRDRLISKLLGICAEPTDQKKEDFNPTAMNSYEAATAQGIDPSLARLSAYRPLDRQWHYPHRRFNDRLRTDLLNMWGSSNVCLYVLPSGTGAGPAAWCHALFPDYHAFRGSYGGYAFPLFDRRRGGDQVNLTPGLLAGLAAAYGTAVPPQDVFDAVLALLSAPSYAALFTEDLEDVFAHVPFPGDHAVFVDAASLGRDIRAVETFARPPGAAFLTQALARLDTTPSAGPLAVVEWSEGGIVLRDDGSGRVSGIPDPVWRFAVSGYRLLPRWLAARQGQPVDAALIEAVRDVAGRIAELLDLFARADMLLARALRDTLSRESLGWSENRGAGEQDEPV